MTQDDDTILLNNLPTELLLLIFTYLPAKQLVRLRVVCSRWKDVIDGMTRTESDWRKHCQRDYRDVYKVARFKARVGMLWFNIYRSLSLWPRLNEAREIRDEFASASRVIEEIRSFEVLQDGMIGVHKRSGIVYYDIETLEPSERSPIAGEYMHYAENTDTIILSDYHLHLFVVRKVLHNTYDETNATFDGVKIILLVEKLLYYVDLSNKIYLCKLDDGDLSSKLLFQSEESVMCIGYTDQLNVLTFQRKIYSYNKGKLLLACNLDDSKNILHELYRFKLLEKVDWRVLFQWMCILGRRVPRGPLQEILTVRIYGDTVLVGCNWGVFRIYHSPFTDGEFDLYNAEPVKQYNFMERSDCPVLTVCPIIGVDIMESEVGHTVLVAMPKKIAVLDFAHSFKRTALAAMLPHSDDMRRVKLIRMNDCADTL